MGAGEACAFHLQERVYMPAAERIHEPVDSNNSAVCFARGARCSTPERGDEYVSNLNRLGLTDGWPVLVGAPSGKADEPSSAASSSLSSACTSRVRVRIWRSHHRDAAPAVTATTPRLT